VFENPPVVYPQFQLTFAINSIWSFLAVKSPNPIELSNSLVTLKPLAVEEAEGYLQIGRDAGIWDFLAPEPFVGLNDAEIWIASMLKRSQLAGDIPFSVYDNRTGKLAGSSSYLDVRSSHGGIEIGFTWYGMAYQRTHVNTAAKLLLFGHAFEELMANRVQLQTDSRNLNSQRAIERLGAVKEGVLRQHKVYPNGYIRDSVLYSITASEWPKVKARLEGFLHF